MLSMLDHQKVLIANLSANPDFVRKEVFKTLRWIDNHEVGEFVQWLLDNYYPLYPELFTDLFGGVASN